jgi:hypothetical protein
VADRHDGCAQKAGGIEALLAVVIAGIFHREGWAVEYLLSVGKIKVVLFQVGFTLGFSPCEVRDLNYTYGNIYSTRPLTSHPATRWCEA